MPEAFVKTLPLSLLLVILVALAGQATGSTAVWFVGYFLAVVVLGLVGVRFLERGRGEHRGG